MPQRLALLIAVTPKHHTEGASVYVPEGKWEIDVSEINDSQIGLWHESPIFSGEFEPYELVEGKIVGPIVLKAGFNKVGTEKHITVTITRCH